MVYLIAHAIVPIINLKTYRKILPIHRQQSMMRKDSTQALHLGRYAESFCLSTHCGTLGGKFPSIDRSVGEL
jgi:hypothetical protein